MLGFNVAKTLPFVNFIKCMITFSACKHICASFVCLPGTSRGQKVVLDTLEFELP